MSLMRQTILLGIFFPAVVFGEAQVVDLDSAKTDASVEYQTNPKVNSTPLQNTRNDSSDVASTPVDLTQSAPVSHPYENTQNEGIAPVRDATLSPVSMSSENAPPPSAVNSNVVLLNRLHQMEEEMRQLKGQLEIQNHEVTMLRQQSTRNMNNSQTLVAQSPSKASSHSTPQDSAIKSESTSDPMNSAEVASEENTPAESLSNPSESLENNSPQNMPNANRFSGLAQTDSSKEASKTVVLPFKTEKEAYQNALQWIKKKDFSSAKASFQAMIDKYPDGKYYPTGLYWLGELNLQAKDYQQAIVGFKKIIEQYPSSEKFSNALLKLGNAYEATHQWSLAKMQFEAIIKLNPSPALTQLANAKLQAMKSKA